MGNLLNVTPDYHITETASGVWRRYLYSNGAMYSEFTSHRRVGSWPLIQIARGRAPATGKIATARGIIAVGQKAVGVLAIGQAAAGVFTLCQVGVGVIAIGQVAAGAVVVAQVALGILAGMGQVATGVFVLAQVGIGLVGLAQVGLVPSGLHFFHKLLR